MAKSSNLLRPLIEAFAQWREDVAERYRKFVWPSPPQWSSFITVVALLVWLFTRHSPNLLIAVLNYLSLTTACCAFVAAFTTKWFSWREFWMAAVPLSLAALLVNGWYDHYTVWRPVTAGALVPMNVPADTECSVRRADTYHRWSGRHLRQAFERIERMGMGTRMTHWSVLEGPVDDDGLPHGIWIHTRHVPRSPKYLRWYFHGEDLPEKAWLERMEEAGEPIPEEPPI